MLKVQSIGGVAQYLVHYQGWNKKFDEWVTDDRVMEATAENIKMAQEMRAKADAEEATRKKQTGGKKKAAAGSAEVGAAAGASASALSGEKRKSVDVVKETVSQRAGTVVWEANQQRWCRSWICATDCVWRAERRHERPGSELLIYW